MQPSEKLTMGAWSARSAAGGHAGAEDYKKTAYKGVPETGVVTGFGAVRWFKPRFSGAGKSAANSQPIKKPRH